MDEIVARSVRERWSRIEAVEGEIGHAGEPANGESRAVQCVHRDSHAYLSSGIRLTSCPRTRCQTCAAGSNTIHCAPQNIRIPFQTLNAGPAMAENHPLGTDSMGEGTRIAATRLATTQHASEPVV